MYTVPSFSVSTSSLNCSIRRAMPNPCRGPSACRVLRIIRSSVPCKTSDLSAAMPAPLDTAKKLPPLLCNVHRKNMSCRTGALRGGRSLRDVYTGRGAMKSCGPSVGRQGILFSTIGRATRSCKKACERPAPRTSPRANARTRIRLKLARDPFLRPPEPLPMLLSTPAFFVFFLLIWLLYWALASFRPARLGRRRSGEPLLPREVRCPLPPAPARRDRRLLRRPRPRA